MSKRIFSQEQIEILLRNPNVAGCSEKSIRYNKNFKISAVRKYQSGLPASEIFRQAQFEIKMIGHEVPDDCLHRWLKIYRAKGEGGLILDGRAKKSGGRPRGTANLSDQEKLKQLEAENAYLKEENHFLAKLRKKSLN